MCKKCALIFIVFILTAVCGIIIVLKASAQTGHLLINELAWMGSLPEEGETQNQSANDEWIELYNNSGISIELSGWILKSLDGSPYIVLYGTVQPQEYYLLSRSNEMVSDINADIVYPYSQQDRKSNALLDGGEYIQLIDPYGNIIDEVNASEGWFAGDKELKRTMERKSPNLTGSEPLSWLTSLAPGGTPRYENNAAQEPAGDDTEINEFQNQSDVIAQSKTETGENEYEPYSDTQETLDENRTYENQTYKDTAKLEGAPHSSQKDVSADINAELVDEVVYPSQIYINELMPSPLGDDSTDEWVEILNKNDEPANLSSWKIRDTGGDSGEYVFPAQFILDAGAFAVLSRATTQITLNNNEDGLELLNPKGDMEDSVIYTKPPSGQSYAKFDGQWMWSQVPTPGSANILPAPKKELPPAKIAIKDTLIQTPTPKSAANAHSEMLLKNSVASGVKTASVIGARDNRPHANGAKNYTPYLIALLLAVFSPVFVFFLKKRARTDVNMR